MQPERLKPLAGDFMNLPIVAMNLGYPRNLLSQEVWNTYSLSLSAVGNVFQPGTGPMQPGMLALEDDSNPPNLKGMSSNASTDSMGTTLSLPGGRGMSPQPGLLALPTVVQSAVNVTLPRLKMPRRGVPSDSQSSTSSSQISTPIKDHDDDVIASEAQSQEKKRRGNPLVDMSRRRVSQKTSPPTDVRASIVEVMAPAIQDRVSLGPGAEAPEDEEIEDDDASSLDAVAGAENEVAHEMQDLMS